MTALTPRERFFALLSPRMPRPVDAIVVLAGEDAMPRAERGYAAFAQLAQAGAPTMLVVSGGLSDPPHLIGASSLRAWLLGKSVAPGKIIVEGESQSTVEQARNVVDLARANGWTSLLLIASEYHVYRAFLTFLAVLIDRDLTKEIRLDVLPSNQSSWSGSPDGLSITRAQLLAIEAQKIEEYRERGHVASYDEGIDYLLAWEKKP